MNLNLVPLWLFFITTIVIILTAVEVGFALGTRAAHRSRDEKESPVAAMGGAVLGLVAFMLAFTFGMAAARYDARKELVRDDAGAIRTAWLTADFFPEQERDDVRRLLKEYLDIRLQLARSWNLAAVPEAEARSTAIHKQLWSYAAANGRKDNSDIGALVAESINELIRVHHVRVAVAVDSRIPLGIWAVLYALSALGMTAMGYQAGIACARRPRTSVLLALSFALVNALIAGLDRPDTPYVSITQKPLRDVRTLMDQPPPDSPPADQR